MRIRPYAETDEAAVVALWERCGLTRPWNDPHKDIARKLGVQRELFLVGDEEGLVVASAMGGYDGHRGWVYYLAVHPEHRHRGHGRALLRALEDRLRSLGCPKINLLIRTSNSALATFYTALGYAQDGVVSYGRRLIADDAAAPPQRP